MAVGTNRGSYYTSSKMKLVKQIGGIKKTKSLNETREQANGRTFRKQNNKLRESNPQKREPVITFQLRKSV